jgi:hypothetical protein
MKTEIPTFSEGGDRMSKSPLEGKWFITGQLYPTAGQIIQHVDAGLYLVAPASTAEAREYPQALYGAEDLRGCALYDNRDEWQAEVDRIRSKSR